MQDGTTKVAFYVQRGDGVDGLPCDLALIARDDDGARVEMRQRVASVRWGLNLVEVEGAGPDPDLGAREYLVSGCADRSARMVCEKTHVRVTFHPERVSRILCGPPLPIVSPPIASLSTLAAVGMSALAFLAVHVYRRATLKPLEHVRSPRWKRKTNKARTKRIPATKMTEHVVETSPSSLYGRIVPLGGEYADQQGQDQPKTMPPKAYLPAEHSNSAVTPSASFSTVNFYEQGDMLLLESLANDPVPIPSADTLSTTASFRDFLEHTVYKTRTTEKAKSTADEAAEAFDYDFSFTT